jgi:hypothetical protein
MQEISGLAEELSASQGRLCFTELLSLFWCYLTIFKTTSLPFVVSDKTFVTLLVLFLRATRIALFELWDEAGQLWSSSWNIHFRVTSFPLVFTRITFYVKFYVLWPCTSIHLCNKNHLDARFIVSLYRQSTSTCFEHICSPSSGGTLYIYNNW